MSCEIEGNAGLLRECRLSWDHWERFATSPRALPCMFIWAFAEAIFWPLIPEFLLVPLAAGRRRNFGLLLGAAILGSAVGGTALYLFAYMHNAAAIACLSRLPLTGRSAGYVQQRISSEGARAFFRSR